MRPIRPIGTVRGPRDAGEGDWGEVVSTIELDDQVFEASATRGLESFSHIEVVYSFHEIDTAHHGTTRPRDNDDWPEVGILAQRDPRRPNHIGLSVCELLAVDELCLTVRGFDAFDGSPVLDVKPYRSEFGPRGEVREPQWSLELSRNYF